MKTILSIFCFLFLGTLAGADVKSAAPLATQTVSLSANLSAAAFGLPLAVIDSAVSFSFLSDPSVTDLESSLDFFDQQGVKHAVRLFFSKRSDASLPSGQSEWIMRAFIDGGEVLGGTAGVAVMLGSPGVIRFSSTGEQIFPAENTPVIANAVLPAPGFFAFGAQSTPVNFVFNRITSFGSSSGIFDSEQDGQAANCLFLTAPLITRLQRISSLIQPLSTPKSRLSVRQNKRILDQALRELRLAQRYSFNAGSNLCTSSSRDLREDALEDIEDRIQALRAKFRRTERILIVSLLNEEIDELGKID